MSWLRASRISSLGLRPQPAWGIGAAAAERGAAASAATAAGGCGATASWLLDTGSRDSGIGCRLDFAVFEAVADEVAEAEVEGPRLGAPSRQVSIIVEDGRFAAAAGPASALPRPAGTPAAELLVLAVAGIVLDPVPIGPEPLAATSAAAEEPLSAVPPDFL